MSIDTFLLSADTTDLNYPEVRPTLDLNFARVKALDPRITFTRASGGSYVGADGLIKLAGVNEARFDHDPVTGESLGLLIEEARTNLLLRSEEFDNVAWVLFGTASRTANTTVAPNGTTTADSVTLPVSSGILQSASGSANTAYTFSIWIRCDTTKSVRLVINTNLGDPTTLTVTATSSWQRFSITKTTSVGTLKVTSQVDTGGGNTFYLWGAQTEQASFPTSYIPTEGSTRTRAADDASITGKNFSDWYRQDEGTVYFDGTVPAITNDTIGRLIYGFSGGFNFSNSIYIGKSQTSLFISPQIILNNVGYILISFPSLTSNRLKTILALSKFNISCKSDLNSSVVTASTTIPNLPTVDRLQLGAEPWNSPNKFNRNVGTIKRFTYYPKRLTDAQLQVLTR